MSFISGRVGLRVTGLNEAIRAVNMIRTEMPDAKMRILREASTFFVLRAKDHVHKVSGNLARSIKVESITPQRAIVSANTDYAEIEETRPGRRRAAPNTPHPYMKPAALDTGLQMPRMVKKGFDTLFARHKTR